MFIDKNNDSGAQCDGNEGESSRNINEKKKAKNDKKRTPDNVIILLAVPTKNTKETRQR